MKFKNSTLKFQQKFAPPSCHILMPPVGQLNVPFLIVIVSALNIENEVPAILECGMSKKGP